MRHLAGRSRTRFRSGGGRRYPSRSIPAGSAGSRGNNARLGAFIAALEVPGSVQCEQTGRWWWHHDIYEAHPVGLLSYVVDTKDVGNV